MSISIEGPTAHGSADESENGSVDRTTEGAASKANAAIRAFMTERSGRGLWPDEQAEYEQLRAAWASAAREPHGERA